jgi:threonine synthase
MKNSRMNFHKYIDTKYSSETSIVLRYRNAFKSEMTDQEDSNYKEWLCKTSIREGARVFHLMTYNGVEIYILDETSLMHTKTLKSIDGCVAIAKCKLRDYEKVAFESGGNTGTALTEYGQRAGLETFLFLPEENTPLLSSKMFESDKAHLISIEEPGLVKRAAHLFERLNWLKHIPETDWRYEASKFRGFFILDI